MRVRVRVGAEREQMHLAAAERAARRRAHGQLDGARAVGAQQRERRAELAAQLRARRAGELAVREGTAARRRGLGAAVAL